MLIILMAIRARFIIAILSGFNIVNIESIIQIAMATVIITMVVIRINRYNCGIGFVKTELALHYIQYTTPFGVVFVKRVVFGRRVLVIL